MMVGDCENVGWYGGKVKWLILLVGFDDGQTDRLTNRLMDIGDCRVTFATENLCL